MPTFQYKVPRGMSVAEISKQFNLSVQDVLSANKGGAPFVTGQTINLPRGLEGVGIGTLGPTPLPSDTARPPRASMIAGGALNLGARGVGTLMGADVSRLPTTTQYASALERAGTAVARGAGFMLGIPTATTPSTFQYQPTAVPSPAASLRTIRAPSPTERQYQYAVSPDALLKNFAETGSLPDEGVTPAMQDQINAAVVAAGGKPIYRGGKPVQSGEEIRPGVYRDQWGNTTIQGTPTTKAVGTTPAGTPQRAEISGWIKGNKWRVITYRDENGEWVKATVSDRSQRGWRKFGLLGYGSGGIEEEELLPTTTTPINSGMQ